MPCMITLWLSPVFSCRRLKPLHWAVIIKNNNPRKCYRNTCRETTVGYYIETAKQLAPGSYLWILIRTESTWGKQLMCGCVFPLHHNTSSYLSGQWRPEMPWVCLVNMTLYCVIETRATPQTWRWSWKLHCAFNFQHVCFFYMAETQVKLDNSPGEIISDDLVQLLMILNPVIEEIHGIVWWLRRCALRCLGAR